MRRSLTAVLVAMILAVAPLTACSHSAPSASEDKGFATGDGSWSQIPASSRRAAPTLKGKNLDGKDLTTAGSRGKVVVVNVWGSWCAPCRHEAPALVTAAQRTKDVAVFYGINTRDLDRAPAKAFDRAFKVTYPSFYDPDGSLLLDFTVLPPKAIPSTVVIDRDGRVAGRFLGEVSADTLTTAIRDVAKESA